jgi:hypothetical protein
VPVCNYCFAFVHSIPRSERHKTFPVLIILCVAGSWFRRTGLKNNYSRPRILTTTGVILWGYSGTVRTLGISMDSLICGNIHRKA